MTLQRGEEGKEKWDYYRKSQFNPSNILLNLGRRDLPLPSCGIQAPANQFPITHFPQAFWSQLHSPFLFCHSISNSCPLLQSRHLQDTDRHTQKAQLVKEKPFWKVISGLASGTSPQTQQAEI